MNWSDYQLDMFDFVTKGSGNGAGIAVAGSGKSTSAVECMRRLPPVYEGFFTTFSRTATEDLKKKLVGIQNASAGSYNSFGNSIVRAQGKRIRFDEDKTDYMLRFKVMDNFVHGEEDRDRFYKHRYTIRRLISLFKGECCFSVDAAQTLYPELVTRHGIETPNHGWFDELLFQTYKWCLDSDWVMDYDDQKFMPLFKDMTIPQYDFLIIDEFQDTNFCESRLMLRAGENGRILVVGDPDQSIYGFRGATPNAMGTFITEMKAKLLPLYICYRCSRAVIEEAQKIVPHIEAASDAIEGSVQLIKQEDAEKIVQPGDFVLCRTTAPVVRFCLKRIQEGRTAYVKGKEIGQDIENLITINSDGDSTDIATFKGKLDAWAAERFTRLQSLGKDGQVAALSDKIDTIDALSVECNNVTQLKDKIKLVFRESGQGIICMTAHKSKGLEAKNVFLINPELMPHPKGNYAEEMRLKYVTITRAMENFYYCESRK